ncbi:NAD-dependent epimerase/dehydratase family protein [Candidatus Omnitrophota bacterium]
MDLANKQVMVTGGAGFIGSALVRELLKQRANVIVYDNFLSGDITNLAEVKDAIKIIKRDILDPGFKQVLQDNGVEYLFNLAAEPYIPHCYYRPDKFFEVNANGALNVLLACRDVKVKRMIQYSTSEVYGSARVTPMNEEHPTFPLSTYAVSKLAADRLCFTLHHEQQIPVTILRQFNVFGPRETQPYIIPEIITQLDKSNQVKLGNILARRDLTYVEDAVRASVALMQCEQAKGEVINLGTGVDHSVEEMAQVIGELLGHQKIDIVIDKPRLRPLDVDRLVCDSSKLEQLIGWKPQSDLRRGLESTIKHFREIGNKWIWETKIAEEENVWTEDTENVFQ